MKIFEVFLYFLFKLCSAAAATTTTTCGQHVLVVMSFPSELVEGWID